MGGGVKTQWTALWAVRRMALEKPLCIVLAPRPGFEPGYTAPEAVVLPLDDLGIWAQFKETH